MAINPIQLFSGSSNALVDILNGGNDALTSILDRAIQNGQNMVNNQMKQDSQLLGLRAQETALAQRRGENLQQNNEDAQRNARNAFEFDVKFGANRADTQFAQNRTTANDIFTQNLQNDTFNLNKSNIEADNARMDGALQVRQDDLAATRAFNEGVVNAPAPTTATQEPSLGQKVMGFFGIGGNEAQPETTDYFTQVERARAKQAAAKQLKDPAAYNAAIAEEGAAMQAQVNARNSPTAKPPTRADARAEESLALRKQDIATKAQEKEIASVVADTGAFVPQATLLPEEATAAQKAAAKAYDANRVDSELNSAKNYGEEEYINLVPNLSEPQKAKRRQLWQYANPDGAATPAAQTQNTGLTYDPVTDTWK